MATVPHSVWQMGQLLLLEVVNQLYRQAEWKRLRHCRQGSRGSALLPAWMHLRTAAAAALATPRRLRRRPSGGSPAAAAQGARQAPTPNT